MSHTYRATFVWVADDKAVFSYGQAIDPDFFSLEASRWEDLGEPLEILIGVGVPAETR